MTDESGITVQVDGDSVVLRFEVPEADLVSPPIRLSIEQAIRLGISLTEAGRQARNQGGA